MIDVFFAMIAAALHAPTDDNDITTGVTPMPAPVVTAPVQDGTTEGTIATEGTITTDGALPTAPSSVVVGQGVVIGGNTLLDRVAQGDPAQQAAAPAPAAPAAGADGSVLNMAVVPAGLVAEPQTPLGKFTTATEVKPIMNATKGNWVAVREYDGSDLLYVTHIWSWRCGLSAMAISINDEPMQNWPLPECHTEYATPNAMLEGDGLPYLKLRLGSVDKITIQIIYDDLTGDVATFQRGDVLIP